MAAMHPIGHKRVVASAAMPIDINPILGPGLELDEPSGSRSRSELLAALADAEALICLLGVSVDAELLDAAPKLKIVANFAVGTDNVDIAAATERGIVVTNTPDVLTEATADFAFALLLGCARRLRECDALARSGQWQGWRPDLLLGAAVHGKTLGIIGMGRIGRAVAARAAGFSMPVIGVGRESSTDRKSLLELASESDFVTLHCPLTPETRNIIDAEFLDHMKPTAFLINTARGGCVDEDALIDALDRGEIAGAGLDVFAAEPEIDERLRLSDKTLLAPHAASATTWARGQMATICATAVRDALAGDVPKTAVNR